MRWLYFLILALCAEMAFPSIGDAAELRITPSLCVMDEDESLCAVSVNVAVVANDNARYCLTIAGKGLIRCFAGNRLTELQVYITAESNTRFQLTESESGNQVASAVLKVARYRPTRHQRRYGWGLL